jgi:hypothetical protein
VAEAFCGVGGEVEHEVEAPPAEQLVDRGRLGDTAAHERRASGDILLDTAAQVIEHHHVVSARDQPVGDVRSDETRSTGNENISHRCTLYR